jgi:hypothetical protein
MNLATKSAISKQYAIALSEKNKILKMKMERQEKNHVD